MMRRLSLLAIVWMLAAGMTLANPSGQEAGHEKSGHEATTHETQMDHQATSDHGESELHQELEAVEGHLEEGLEGHDDHAAAGHGEEHGGGGDVMGYLSHHLLDGSNYSLLGYEIPLPFIKGDFSFLGEKYSEGFQITKHMIGLIIAALLAIFLVIPTTGRIKKGDVPHGFGNFLEVLILFVRDEVVYANMGKEEGRKWLPFFLTLFFLILFSNLLGMIPWGTTPTGNVSVTAGLAIATLLAVFFAGIKHHGIKYLGTFVPHGVPIFVAPILFPIEVFGLFVKHFALTIRLFANMLAGHTVIGVFMALILVPAVALAAVPGAVVISMLELFVAFLQAYVFVMLGSLFVASSIHPH
ncbi:F0F1 ATP synthase subunit A [bacterium]|nr:F0F1 ATP synthase subunit A [bacterium]